MSLILILMSLGSISHVSFMSHLRIKGHNIGKQESRKLSPQCDGLPERYMQAADQREVMLVIFELLTTNVNWQIAKCGM